MRTANRPGVSTTGVFALGLMSLCLACADGVPEGAGGDAGDNPPDALTTPRAPNPAPGEESLEPTPAGEETCEGTDDDGDGRVDEGCACTGSTTCYGGPAGTRGVGDCADGARACDALGELWEDCRYWTGPSEEVCGGGDEDCDGQTDEGCEPSEEVCGNGVDEDLDGQVDENCVDCGGPEICENGTDDDCDGAIDEGCEPGCGPEICADALDNDCDGDIDEDCTDDCAPDLSRACFPGPPALIGVGACRAGLQRCTPGRMWGACEGAVAPGEEVCDNGLDDDCNGLVDEGCMECGAEVCGDGVDGDCDGQVDEGCEPPVEGPVEVPILLLGDCLTAQCPAATPHPVGCQVFFTPGDDRGCVANAPGSPVVYFQAGDACNRGFITGTLLCAEEAGEPLSPANCPINKPIPIYPADRSGCPEVED